MRLCSYRGVGDLMKRALSIVILGVLVLAIVPSGSIASENVGTATVDLFQNPDSVEAFVPDVQNFNYHVGGSPPYTVVTIVLDCEVDDNNNVDDISTLIKIHGSLYFGGNPTVLAFDLDDWTNPTSPTDNTANWPIGRTETNQLSITFGPVPSNPPGYWIACQITADIYSVDQNDTAHAEIDFVVTIVP